MYALETIGHEIFYYSNEELKDISNNKEILDWLLTKNYFSIFKYIAYKLGRFYFIDDTYTTTIAELICEHVDNSSQEEQFPTFQYYFIEAPAIELKYYYKYYITNSSCRSYSDLLHLAKHKKYKTLTEITENNLKKTVAMSEKYLLSGVRHDITKKRPYIHINSDLDFNYEIDKLPTYVSDIVTYHTKNTILIRRLLQTLKETVPTINDIGISSCGGINDIVAKLISGNLFGIDSLLHIINNEDTMYSNPSDAIFWQNPTPLTKIINRSYEDRVKGSISILSKIMQVTFFNDSDFNKNHELKNRSYVAKTNNPVYYITGWSNNINLFRYIVHKGILPIDDIDTSVITSIANSFSRYSPSRETKLNYMAMVYMLFYCCRIPLTKFHHANFKLINDPTLLILLKYCKKHKKLFTDITEDDLICMRMKNDEFDISLWDKIILSPVAYVKKYGIDSVDWSNEK